MQFDFRTLRECLIHIEVFTDKGGLIDGDVVDLVVKQVVEVSGIEDIFSMQEILLDARLEGADPLWLETGIWNGIGRSGERLFQAGLLVSRGVGKTQARSRKSFSTPSRQQS